MYFSALQVDQACPGEYYGEQSQRQGIFARERDLLFIRQRHLSGCADSRVGRGGRLNVALRPRPALRFTSQRFMPTSTSHIFIFFEHFPGGIVA